MSVASRFLNQSAIAGMAGSNGPGAEKFKIPRAYRAAILEVMSHPARHQDKGAGTGLEPLLIHQNAHGAG